MEESAQKGITEHIDNNKAAVVNSNDDVAPWDDPKPVIKKQETHVFDIDAPDVPEERPFSGAQDDAERRRNETKKPDNFRPANLFGNLFSCHGATSSDLPVSSIAQVLVFCQA